jgi:hypothetical protein
MLDMKAVFEALLPPGSLWQPAPQAGFDQFMTALGQNANEIYERLFALGDLRNPRKTPILSDLEKEYGLLPDDRLDDDTRRQKLAAVKYAKPGTASDTDLQTILRNAGFDVYVRRNDPPVDPDDLLSTEYLLEAGEVDAFAGEPNAIAGLGGGELVVNGPIVKTSLDYSAQANGAETFAGEPEAVAGYFEEVAYTPVTYTVPASADTWPYIFFVTGQEWGKLNDWNAEYATNGSWTLGPDAMLEKNIDPLYINSGIRSFKLTSKTDHPVSSSDCYFEQVFDPPIEAPTTISLRYWTNIAGQSGQGEFYIQEPGSSTWNLKGVTLPGQSDFLWTTSSSLPNGIQGIRLAMTTGGAPTPPAVSTVYFDQILLEPQQYERAEVPSEREGEFKRLILSYKPLGTWAGLLVDYV